MKEFKPIVMEGVVEYNEEMEVVLQTAKVYDFNVRGYRDTGRLVIRAYNKAGYNSTEVDLVQVIEWVKANMPELL
jgi:lactam utilization protein B